MKIKMLCIDRPRILCVVENTRDQQKTWIEALRAAKGGTLTDLARACGLHQTTLTRWWSDPQDKALLGPRSLAQIADHTGWHPYSIPDPNVPKTLPATSGDLVVIPPDSTAWQMDLQSYIETMTNAHPGLFPRLITTRALETAGFLPGDICLIDQNVKPREGDAVCATVDLSRAGPMRAESVLRLYFPPYLVAATHDAKLRRPMQVDEREVVIMGVVVGMFRARLAQAA